MIIINDKYRKTADEIEAFIKQLKNYSTIVLETPFESKEKIIKLIAEHTASFQDEIIDDDFIRDNTFYYSSQIFHATDQHTHVSLTSNEMPLEYWANGFYNHVYGKQTYDNSEATKESWLDNQLKMLQYEAEKDTNVPSY
jgi:hypothetical protein